MKTLLNLKKTWILVLAFMVSASAYAFNGDEELNDTINFKAYYGRVVDIESGRTLPFATRGSCENLPGLWG